MADRPSGHRGGGRGGGHRGRGGGRGRGGAGASGEGGHGGRGGGHHHHHGGGGGSRQEDSSAGPKKEKENILDLAKYMDKRMAVTFNGGREASGILKGFDALMNLVLDDAEEILRDEEGNEKTRSLGLVVVRGTLVVLINPTEGTEVIDNPFTKDDDDDEKDED